MAKHYKVNINRLAVGVLGVVLIVLAVANIRAAKGSGTSPNRVMPILFIVGWLFIILALNLNDNGSCITPDYNMVVRSLPAIVIIIGALMGGSGKAKLEKVGAGVFILGWMLLVLTISYNGGKLDGTMLAMSTASALSIAGGMMLIRKGGSSCNVQTMLGWSMFGGGWIAMVGTIAVM